MASIETAACSACLVDDVDEVFIQPIDGSLPEQAIAHFRAEHGLPVLASEPVVDTRFVAEVDTSQGHGHMEFTARNI